MRALPLLIALALAGCTPRLEAGRYACDKDEAGGCPAGWLCQCRGAGCQWRCFPEEGGYCGDGKLDADEQCDGEQFAAGCSELGLGDGFQLCTVDCLLHCTVCGDGRPELTSRGEGEQCDDGNLVAGDGCSPTCRLERCGNGVQDRYEVCDDGNNVSKDGCSADCLSKEVCGNGYVDSVRGEQCDLGAANSNAPDAPCRPDCLPRRCGDGVRDEGAQEKCDGQDFGALTCAAAIGQAWDGKGELACTKTCEIDYRASCRERPAGAECGNGVREDEELCDKDDLGLASCLLLGYQGGTLRCLSGFCAYDTSGCIK